MDRAAFGQGATPRKHYLAKLQADARKYQTMGVR
jgi:hypothetical protein